jgi:FkbM family methyltransferase
LTSRRKVPQSKITGHSGGYLYRIRERFHPLNHLRRHRLSRAILQAIDVPIWASLPGVCWKVRVRLVRHACFFVLAEGLEPGVSALVSAIGQQLGIRSFWDVGANIGYYTWLVKSIAPSAEVRMFEPDSDNLALIRATICRQTLNGITVREVVVSDTPGMRSFSRDWISGSTGGVLENGVSYSERQWGVAVNSVTVPAISLDHERAATGGVDLIKIDVEGHEEAVIHGGLETIRRDQPIVIFECFHGGSDIINALRPLGYVFTDAERMALDLRRTSNFLALPRRHLAVLEELGRWRDGVALI